jgi:phosphoglycolate phosphatase
MNRQTLKLGAPIFLDLDGVLLDVSDRYFRVHRASIEPAPGGGLDRAAFWTLKRARRPIRQILEADGAGHIDEPVYMKQFIEKIEAPELLRYDTLFPGAREHLAALAQKRPLVLATLRRRQENLAAQLDLLGVRPFFEAVLVGSPPAQEGWKVKAGLLRESPWLRGDALIVGDTEVDIRAGKAVGIKTIAVCSGIRDREALQSEGPDMIVADLHSLLEVLGDLQGTGRESTVTPFLPPAHHFRE